MYNEKIHKMAEETKDFLTFDHPEDVKADILRQVAEAEAKGLYEYVIKYRGGEYTITNSLIRGQKKYL